MLFNPNSNKELDRPNYSPFPLSSHASCNNAYVKNIQVLPVCFHFASMISDFSAKQVKRYLKGAGKYPTPTFFFFFSHGLT